MKHPDLTALQEKTTDQKEVHPVVPAHVKKRKTMIIVTIFFFAAHNSNFLRYYFMADKLFQSGRTAGDISSAGTAAS